MPDQETKPEGQEPQLESPHFPEWMTEMMSACGPEMLDRMEKCFSSMRAFAGCCGSRPEKETTEKA